jgi:hypothetical protein
MGANGGSTWDEYLASLPPDDRAEQERPFKEDPVLRAVVHALDDRSPAELRVLMAEVEEYLEMGRSTPSLRLG